MTLVRILRDLLRAIAGTTRRRQRTTRRADRRSDRRERTRSAEKPKSAGRRERKRRS